MSIKIQIGSADSVERYDTNVKSKDWETIVSAYNSEMALEKLVELINSDNINLNNSFLRILSNGK